MGLFQKIKELRLADKASGAVLNEAYSSADFYDPLNPGAAKDNVNIDPSGIVKTSEVYDQGIWKTYVAPIVPFNTQLTYYYTVPKIQAAVDKTVEDISNREYYFGVSDDVADKGQTFKAQISKMEDWAQKYRAKKLIKSWLRTCQLIGNQLVSTKDWVNVQMSSVIGVQRDDFGNPMNYFYYTKHGMTTLDDPNTFLHLKWVEMDRQPWAIGRFFSAFNDQFIDPDVKHPKSIAAIHRTLLQDAGKIHHKLAAPRVIYTVLGTARDVFERDIKPLFQALQPGGRLVLDKEVKMQGEPVDSSTRFQGLIDVITKEMDVGSQSNVGRITHSPSSMADGKVANNQDEERSKAAADWVKEIFDDYVIPIVLGEQYRGKIMFYWGQEEDFKYDPTEWLGYFDRGIVSDEEIRDLIKESRGGKLDDTKWEQFKADKEQKQAEIQQNSKKADSTSYPATPKEDGSNEYNVSI